MAAPTTTEAPTPEAASAHVVTPPTLMSEVDVPYPASGVGEGIVVLAVTVNADGTVRSSARCIAGEEPFVGAALARAPAWRFHSALRDGRPVAASSSSASRLPFTRVSTVRLERRAARRSWQRRPSPRRDDGRVFGARSPGPGRATSAGWSRPFTRAEVRQPPARSAIHSGPSRPCLA